MNKPGFKGLPFEAKLRSPDRNMLAFVLSAASRPEVADIFVAKTAIEIGGEGLGFIERANEDFRCGQFVRQNTEMDEGPSATNQFLSSWAICLRG